MYPSTYKATIEVGDRRITFEGPREFVEGQVAKFAEASSKLQAPKGIDEFQKSNRDNEGPTARSLVAEKRPKGHLETVAVLAFHLRESGLQEFTDADMRKAYIQAGLRPPKVVAQALGDAKNKLDLLERGRRRGVYRLSDNGDRIVRFDLPRDH